jgi:uncharacterized protein YndB with AHSA1/START domain
MAESTVVQADEREITITRVFDAPRELVFQAWTDPDHLARWFGPAGFEIPRDSVHIEPRVGGRITLRMVQPGSGHQFDLDYEILELVEPELLVLKSGPNPEMGLHHEVVTVSRSRTRTARHASPSPTAPTPKRAAAGPAQDGTAPSTNSRPTSPRRTERIGERTPPGLLDPREFTAVVDAVEEPARC